MNILWAYSLIWQQLDNSQPITLPGPVLGDNWSLFTMTLKMCLTLGAVCLLAYVTLRYGLPRVTGFNPETQIIKVLSRYPIEQQKTLYIVEVTGKHFLLGVTAENIQLLAELPAEDVNRSLELVAAQEASRPSLSAKAKDFSKYLRR